MKRLIFVILFAAPAFSASALVYERFEQDGKMGIRDEQGHVLVPAAFDALGWSDGSFSVVGRITGYRQGNRWGLLNLQKEFITKAEYLSLTAAGGNYVRASREVSPLAIKVGCVDLQGHVVIPMIYDDVVLHDLRAIVMVKEGVRYKYGLVDLSNRVVLPAAYRQITPLGSLRYAVKNFDGKTALFAESGQWITEFDIDSLSTFRFDLAILYKGLHRGVIDRAGEVRVEPVYKEIQIEESGKVKVKRPNSWMIIDDRQNELHRAAADAMTVLGSNRFRLTLNGKSGIVDSLFRTVIPIAHDYIGPVQNEIFIVGNHRKYGLMRTDRSLILPLAFDTLLREGHLLRAQTSEAGRKSWDLYDTVGVRKTAEHYDFLGAPMNGLRPAYRKGFVGAIDASGTERVACVYDSLLEINDVHIAVKFKGLYGIISRDDFWLLAPQPNPIRLVDIDRYIERQGAVNFLKDFSGQLIYFTDQSLTIHRGYLTERSTDGSEKEINYHGQRIEQTSPGSTVSTTGSIPAQEGLFVVQRDGKFGFVDHRGRLRIANRYEAAGNFQEERAPVRLLGKWGFIDPSDQIIIQPVYDRRADFQNGICIVARNGKEGVIDRSGALLLELRYDSIRRWSDQSLTLFRDGRQGLADGRGRILLEPRFDSIQPIGGDRVIVRQDGKYGLLSREGLSLFPMRYDFLQYQSATGTFMARETFDWETLALK